jgi:UrcA family protein
MKPTLSIIALSAAICAGGTAQAQSWAGAERISMSVPIDDLDLSTRAGEAELDRRIHRAVARICDSDRQCRDMAWDSAWYQMDNAIARDREMRHLANERRAQLRPRGRVTVITLSNDGSPARVDSYEE